MERSGLPTHSYILIISPRCGTTSYKHSGRRHSPNGIGLKCNQRTAPTKPAPFFGRQITGKPRSVLLSTACPTSLASDQTKGGGWPGVQRTPRFGDREQRFDLTKIQLSSKLSPKDPKEIAKKFRDATGEPREKRLLQITNLKVTLQRFHRLCIYHAEKRCERATPEIFLLSSLASSYA